MNYSLLLLIYAHGQVELQVITKALENESQAEPGKGGNQKLRSTRAEAAKDSSRTTYLSRPYLRIVAGKELIELR
jgi:hypothetical protein